MIHDSNRGEDRLSGIRASKKKSVAGSTGTKSPT